MLTQHNRKTARLSPDYTFAIRELGVWSGDETKLEVASHYCLSKFQGSAWCKVIRAESNSH